MPVRLPQANAFLCDAKQGAFGTCLPTIGHDCPRMRPSLRKSRFILRSLSGRVRQNSLNRRFEPPQDMRTADAGARAATRSRRACRDAQPSRQAMPTFVSRALGEAAKIIEIELLAHVIVGDPKADPLGVRYYFRSAR